MTLLYVDVICGNLTWQLTIVAKNINLVLILVMDHHGNNIIMVDFNLVVAKLPTKFSGCMVVITNLGRMFKIYTLCMHM